MNIQKIIALAESISLPTKGERYPIKGVWVNSIVILFVSLVAQYFAATPDYFQALSHAYYGIGGMLVAWFTWKTPTCRGVSIAINSKT